MSSPRFAQSKGLAERSVQTIKNMLKKSEDQYNSLLSYRTTPLANGYSPAELLMGRKLRTLLPVAPKNSCTKITQHSRHRARPFSKVKTNDRVWVKDQKRRGIIKAESNEPRSYIIETDSGEIRRNRRHFSNFPEKPDTKISKNTFETIPNEIPIYNNELRDNQTDQSDKSDFYVTKSGRISKPPDKLDL
ncbi:unnamed protein product [Mytilus coruscus]|uniref:Integrase catalytic domain-containing protein n=1 Tax=Mytilus coruscus TaxID=42192 RepID=A0A6J8EL53_MYTCO|nr:unnamed protein product [Mytilus coruscus]